MIDDAEAVESAEASIDAFINARSKAKKEANDLEAAWAESERRHRERRREKNRQAWLDHYALMHRLHLGLAAEHADRRSRLLAECGYEPEEVPEPPEAA